MKKLLFLFVTCLSAFCTLDAQNATAEVQFIITSPAAYFNRNPNGTNTLVLEEVQDTIGYFWINSERLPGAITLTEFVKIWQDPQNYFVSTPPQAHVFYLASGGLPNLHVVPVQLGTPSYNATETLFEVPVTPAGTKAALPLDDIENVVLVIPGLSCLGGVAGQQCLKSAAP